MRTVDVRIATVVNREQITFINGILEIRSRNLREKNTSRRRVTVDMELYGRCLWNIEVETYYYPTVPFLLSIYFKSRPRPQYLHQRIISGFPCIPFQSGIHG